MKLAARMAAPARLAEHRRADVRLQRQLAAAAAEWEHLQRDPGYLLVGPRLAQFEGWAARHGCGADGGRARLPGGQPGPAPGGSCCRSRAPAARTGGGAETGESEKQRAEEQTRAAVRLRWRNRVITVIGVLALFAAIAAAIFGITANANFNRADQAANGG